MTSLMKRIGLVAVAAASCTLVAVAQAPPAQTKAAPKSAAQPAKANPVLATVNGEPIYESEVARALNQFQARPGSEQELYDNVMEMLVNSKLLAQFLRRNRVEVKPADIDEVVADYEKAAKQNNNSLVNELAAANWTPEEFRNEIARTLQFKNYVTSQATDSELRRYAEANKDTFNSVQARASHILVPVKPDASDAEKQKAREKLLAIKKDIVAGKISFPDAANKYSEDPGNQQTPNGGDLGFFYRREPFIEEFSAAAFGLKKGEISDIVETEYGYHLIHLTDRRDGQPYDFARDKPQILDQYASDLRLRITEQERAKAEEAKAIQVQPMPKDLVKTVPSGPAAAPAPAGTTPKAAPKPAAAPAKSAAPRS